MPNTPHAERAFAAQWIMDEVPACPKGLIFLRRLSEDAPRLYKIAERHGFCNPVDEKLREHPLWHAFLDHYAGCDDCNEV